MAARKANIAFGILGSAVGAAIGFMLFFVLAQQGLYALALPGAAVGIACGWLSGGRSIPLGVVCAVVAFALGVVIEWKSDPFPADESFSYFVTHLHQLKRVTQIMLAVGAVFGFWFGIGRDRDIGFSERPRRPVADDDSDRDSDDDGTAP
ncbi:MAG: hypothetical protein R3C19_08485 [Planctomycetaceae bacterium]